MTTATLPETPYAFDRCDECGAPLEPGDRFVGLCAACQKQIAVRNNSRKDRAHRKRG